MTNEEKIMKLKFGKNIEKFCTRLKENTNEELSKSSVSFRVAKVIPIDFHVRHRVGSKKPLTELDVENGINTKIAYLRVEVYYDDGIIDRRDYHVLTSVNMYILKFEKNTICVDIADENYTY